jgi:hypothetical protein
MFWEVSIKKRRGYTWGFGGRGALGHNNVHEKLVPTRLAVTASSFEGRIIKNC